MTVRDLALRHGGAMLLGIGVLGIGATSFLTVTNSVGAMNRIRAAAATPISCSARGSAACLTVTNTSFGAAIVGTSDEGPAFRGQSISSYGVKGTSSSNYGVYGQTTSGGAGVFGTMTSGTGVFGTGGGTGVEGSSGSGYGVYGTTTSGNGDGVVGNMPGGGTGLYGSSSSGYGAEAFSDTGGALLAQADSSGTAAYISSSTGYGVIAKTGGNIAVYGRNTAGNGADFEGTYVGLLGRAPASGGFPLTLTDENSNDVFYVDGTGNVYYHGGLFTFARMRNGATATAYGSKSTEPTMEDTGTSHLVNGTAAVPLDRVFAAAIDSSAPYRVFITPDGDSRGLYVAQKSPTGFVVRESQGGRSTLDFDYRIVATSLGHARERMALANQSQLRAPRALIPTLPAPERTQPVKAPRIPRAATGP